MRDGQRRGTQLTDRQRRRRETIGETHQQIRGNTTDQLANAIDDQPNWGRQTETSAGEDHRHIEE